MPRISGLAWLFVALAILSVVEPLVTFVRGFGWAFSFTPDAVIAAFARALPILIPSAALWRTDRTRPRSLLLGSVAVGVGAALASGLSEPWASVDPVFGGGGLWQFYGGLDDVLWVITLTFTLAGPIVLGNAVRGRHGRAWTRRGIRAAVAVGGLTIGFFALRVAFPLDLYHRFVPDPSNRLEFFGVPSLGNLEAPTLIGWAYFAWAVISAGAGDGQRRGAWLMARAAMMIQQGLVALTIVVTSLWFFLARSGGSKPFTDAVVWASGVVFFVTPVLVCGASVLLIAAFAAGVADPAAVEPDGERRNLEPFANPG